MPWKAFAVAMVIVAALLVVGCQAAPTPAPAAPAAQLAAHRSLDDHPFKPKRLEAVVQIDMNEMYFSTPEGEKNPTVRLPAGKTVGIHIHNEGTAGHELAIGRKVKVKGTEGYEYEEVLTERVPSDLFFYYGQAKAEVEDALFGEIEFDPGIRDVWLRLVIPKELKGEWEIGCFYEGHYEAGMKTRLIVE